MLFFWRKKSNPTSGGGPNPSPFNSFFNSPGVSPAPYPLGSLFKSNTARTRALPRSALRNGSCVDPNLDPRRIIRYFCCRGFVKPAPPHSCKAGRIQFTAPLCSPPSSPDLLQRAVHGASVREIRPSVATFRNSAQLERRLKYQQTLFTPQRLFSPALPRFTAVQCEAAPRPGAARVGSRSPSPASGSVCIPICGISHSYRDDSVKSGHETY